VTGSLRREVLPWRFRKFSRSTRAHEDRALKRIRKRCTCLLAHELLNYLDAMASEDRTVEAGVALATLPFTLSQLEPQDDPIPDRVPSCAEPGDR
jgi:hypothetical protein